MKRFVRGFSLIELMMVVLVMGILMAIALPSYTAHLQKSRRAGVKAQMLEVVQSLERQYTTSNSYAGLPLTTAQSKFPSTGTSAYTLRLVVAADGQTYSLAATPAGVQSTDPCGTLTITETNTKTRSGSASMASCW